MMASASWARAWIMRVSRVTLGLALAVILTGCGVDAGGGKPPGARSGFDVGQGAHAGSAPGELPRGPAARRRRGVPLRRAPLRRRGGPQRRARLEVALGGGALDVTRAGASLSRGAAVDGARAGLAGRAGGEAGRRGRGGREPRELPARGRERGGVRQRAARASSKGSSSPSPPAGASGEALAVEVSVEGDLAPVLVEGGAGVALRDARGATVARYTDLAAFDADGVERRSWLEVSGGVVRLRVDDEGARYPLRIDPLVWTQEAGLTASNGTGWTNLALGVGERRQSPSSAPPSTRLAATQAGAAYVFVQSGTTWTQQAELTASDGAAGDQFGGSVSLSGGTAIVGADEHQVGGNVTQGAAYVFVQSGTTWTQPSLAGRLSLPGRRM